MIFFFFQISRKNEMFRLLKRSAFIALWEKLTNMDERGQQLYYEVLFLETLMAKVAKDYVDLSRMGSLIDIASFDG